MNLSILTFGVVCAHFFTHREQRKNLAVIPTFIPGGTIPVPVPIQDGDNEAHN